MNNTYGHWLKVQREAASMTQQELADAAFMTRSHISHIEAGRRVPSDEDARRLDRALGTGDVLQTFLPPQEETLVPARFETALQLERQATMICEFALTLMPGVLQTEAYMRAVLAAAVPPWSEAECDKIIRTRLNRAKILEEPITPVVWALLSEYALRRPVGGSEVMAQQLMHVARLAASRRVRVHVLPDSIGAHPLQMSMLTLMSFEDQPPVAYTEALESAQLHDSPAVVERLRTAYDSVLGDALPRKESLALLKTTAKEFGHHD